MTESRQDQENRHKALDLQRADARTLKFAALSFRRATKILRHIDWKAESDLRYVEEIIADIRAQHPRKGQR